MVVLGQPCLRQARGIRGGITSPLREQSAASTLTIDELAYLFTDYLTDVVIITLYYRFLYYRLGYARLFHVNISGYIEGLEAITGNSSLSTCIY
ncbi:hypothetical protein XBFM1_1090002 [Xenorhabdus bovienii str. feltiae Moldova]|uniref:Uncharacterized protein n=1 Tax=Xenorhabdus bovienii str. feltiae Moldova TaxID=1398200 RepID=A0A077NMN4_XENBV|nr:hypothetical protein XBFM1_1090002 [Xenorhabdus bovienii str. feltiae Moldova]